MALGNRDKSGWNVLNFKEKSVVKLVYNSWLKIWKCSITNLGTQRLTANMPFVYLHSRFALFLLLSGSSANCRCVSWSTHNWQLFQHPRHISMLISPNSASACAKVMRDRTLVAPRRTIWLCSKLRASLSMYLLGMVSLWAAVVSELIDGKLN